MPGRIDSTVKIHFLEIKSFGVHRPQAASSSIISYESIIILLLGESIYGTILWVFVTGLV